MTPLATLYNQRSSLLSPNIPHTICRKPDASRRFSRSLKSHQTRTHQKARRNTTGRQRSYGTLIPPSSPSAREDEGKLVNLMTGEPDIECEMSYNDSSSRKYNFIGAATPRDQPVSGREELPLSTKGETPCCSKDAAARSRYFIRNVKCFGVELSPDNVAVAMVYFVQGVLGLSRLAVSFYLKDDLRLDPAETAVISGVSALPWLIKPLYGFISDSFPLFGYRRRSYLVLAGLLGALSWGMMATVVGSKYSAAASILLGSLSVAFSDVQGAFDGSKISC